MQELPRRHVLKLLTAGPLLLQAGSTLSQNAYQKTNGSIEFHTTAGYPDEWKTVYKNTIDHFAKKWGRVGPVRVFLVENSDWKPQEGRTIDKAALLESQRMLKQKFADLQGHGGDGKNLDWKTGQHWMSWSVKPANLMITMTMSPYRDAEQFVIGPVHEYFHAYQAAYGFGNPIDGNQMGHALWTGPAWWREDTMPSGWPRRDAQFCCTAIAIYLR